MEVGLSSNILCEDYERLGNLATGGWWKQLWCLCFKFSVKLSFSTRFLIPLLREGDRSIMDVVCSTDLYTATQREIINRVRKFKGLHSLADITLCDGRTVDPKVMTTDPSDSSRVFSVEKPRRSDFRLFHQAIRNLSSPSLVLSPTLGRFTGNPHRQDRWFLSECRRYLYFEEDEPDAYTRYTCVSERPTRFGTIFSDPEHRQGQFFRGMRASVQPRSDTCVVLHSSAHVYVPSPPRRSFMQRLHALPNQSLWRTLRITGDGTWIYEGVLRDSLVMMSDGSYNERIARDVCSCAVIIHCKATNHRATVTWVEKTSNQSATNYRGEILGSIAIQLLLSVALDGKYVSPSCRPRIGCDNKGVVLHGNHPYRPLPSNQRQADLLRYFKQLIGRSKAKCKMYHVYGHMDRFLAANQRSDEENINVECDHLAESSLLEGVTTGQYIDPIFPDEDIVAMVASEKITGQASTQIVRHWGHETARLHFHSKGQIDSEFFDDVDWDGAEQVLKTSPEMFSVWASKQTSGTCGVNHMLKNFQPGTIDECPNCGFTPERTTHLYVCRNPHRTAVYQSSVSSLHTWLTLQQTDAELISIIIKYLRHRGRQTMLSFCSVFSRYRKLAYSQDCLGFSNFIEGRVTSQFRYLRQWDISRRSLRKHAGHWVKGLILQLLQIVHRQWTYRNGSIHIKLRDGMTEKQHLQLMRRCEELLWTDPTTLLEDDRVLLEMDFEGLGLGEAEDRHLWVSEMEAALAAAQTRRRECNRIRLARRLGATQQEQPVDTEGSIRYRRRRRRLSRYIGFWLVQLPYWKIAPVSNGSGCCSVRCHGKERLFRLRYVRLGLCSANFIRLILILSE